MSPLPLGILALSGAGDARAFDLLETTLISTNTASVTFSSLGSYSNYKHLQIRITGRTTRANAVDALSMRLNSDTGSNYNSHSLSGNGTSVSSYTDGSLDRTVSIFGLAGANATANAFGAIVIDILDFSSSSKNTTFRLLGGSGASGIDLSSSLWRNTAAVTSINLFSNNSQNFVSGSRFSLYGIK